MKDGERRKERRQCHVSHFQDREGRRKTGKVRRKKGREKGRKEGRKEGRKKERN